MICPVYILYGMSYEQFWYGDPWMACAYREAHILKRRQNNEQMWIAGAYEHSAVQAVVGSTFGKRRIEYVKKPFEIFEKTKAEKELERREQIERLKQTLDAWKRAADVKKMGVDQNGEPRNT